MFFPLQNLTQEHRKNPGMTKDEAKVAFLKKMQSWPTFGSVFFEAQVCTLLKVTRYPKNTCLSEGLLLGEF